MLNEDDHSWKLSRIIKPSNGPALTIVYDRQGEYCLSSGGLDKLIHLSKPSTGKLLQSYYGHSWEVLSILPYHDNSYFLSAGVDKSILLFDVLSGKTVRKWTGHVGRINSLAFLSASPQDLLNSVRTTSSTKSSSLLTQDSVLASGSEDTSVRLWDLKSSNRYPIQILNEAKDSVTKVQYSSARSHLMASSVDGHLRTYDLRKGLLTVRNIASPITNFLWLEGMTCFVVTTLDSHHHLIYEDELLLSCYGHQNQKLMLPSAVSADEFTLFSGSEDASLYGWSLKSDTTVDKLPGLGFKLVDFAADGCGPPVGIACHPTHSSEFLASFMNGSIRVYAK